jgi:hypothetical protein
VELFDVRLEDIQEECKTLLLTKMPDALALISDYYVHKGSSVPLEPFQKIEAMEVLDEAMPSVFDKYPNMTVEAFSVTNDPTPSEEHTALIDIAVNIWVIGPTLKLADTKVQRYTQAVAAIFANEELNTVDQMGRPDILIGNTSSAAKAIGSRYPGFLKTATLSYQAKKTGGA